MAAGLLASGCATASGQSHSAAEGSHSPPAAAEREATAESAAQARAADSPQCPASALRVSAGAPSGAAGSTYYPLDFINVGHSACTLHGYPEVSFVGAGPSRNELGTPAVRDAGFASHVITLSPGSTAHADLRVQLAQNYPAAICKPVTAHWLRVFAPGSTRPQYLRFTAVTCAGTIPSGSTIGIYTVRPGATAP